MHLVLDDSVALRCEDLADAEALRRLVEDAGFRVTEGARLSLWSPGASPPPPPGSAWVALVDTEEEALQAVRAGAFDAIVWPGEAHRLGRALEGAQRRMVDAAGHHVYREVFRRSASWLELTDDEVTLVDVSQGFEEMSGYPRAEAIGRTPAQLFRGGTHGAAFYEGVVQELERSGRWHGDMLGRRPDGSLAVLEVEVGRLTAPCGAMAQFAVKRPLGRVAPGSLGGWVEGHASAPWLLVERRSGAIVEVGARAPDALGLDRSTLLSTPFPDLALDLELPRPDLQARQDRWVGDRAYDVFASGRVVGDVDLVLVVFHDVTERLLRAEELDALAHDLAVARDQALAADRTKTAFLAGMSHELRTPLTAILGYAELLADDLDDPSWLADLGRITTAGTHLLRLVDEVLDLARVESGEVALAMEAFPVGPLLEEVADSVRLRAAAGGKEIAVEVVDDLCLWGDRQRVLQVMLNLVVNAVKYAVPGRVLVGVERGVEGRWALFVEDEGPGLTPQQQVRIFHAFRQLHDVSDGVGLGLAISRRLAEAMGGDLTVASTPDGGSRFRLWLDAPEASRLEPRGLDRVNRSRRSDTPRPSQEVPHGPHVGIGSR